MQKIGVRQTAGGNLPFANARAHQPMTLKGKSGNPADAADALSRCLFRLLGPVRCSATATLIPCTIIPTRPDGERAFVQHRCGGKSEQIRPEKMKENKLKQRKDYRFDLKIVTAVVLLQSVRIGSLIPFLLTKACLPFSPCLLRLDHKKVACLIRSEKGLSPRSNHDETLHYQRIFHYNHFKNSSV
jgi:hypothetical protein